MIGGRIGAMPARIYKPARTAMQSGWANTQEWVLEFAPATASERDPLMGWTSSADTDGQVRLRFPDEAAAVAYAKRHGIGYVVEPPETRLIKPKSYADNFRYDREQ
jgi:hypothetical protein